MGYHIQSPPPDRDDSAGPEREELRSTWLHTPGVMQAAEVMRVVGGIPEQFGERQMGVKFFELDQSHHPQYRILVASLSQRNQHRQFIGASCGS